MLPDRVVSLLQVIERLHLGLARGRISFGSGLCQIGDRLFDLGLVGLRGLGRGSLGSLRGCGGHTSKKLHRLLDSLERREGFSGGGIFHCPHSCYQRAERAGLAFSRIVSLSCGLVVLALKHQVQHLAEILGLLLHGFLAHLLVLLFQHIGPFFGFAPSLISLSLLRRQLR